MFSMTEPMTRREFGRRAGLVAGGVAFGSTLLGRAAAGASPKVEPLLAGAANECPIDTIVVLMMENRSFDHYLGWLGHDEAYLDAGRRRWGSGFAVEARQHLHYQDPTGKLVATESLTTRPDESNPYRICSGPAPGHGWHAGRAQRDHGFLSKGSHNTESAIGYYERS